ncbi:MAG: hypothetical protein AAGN46_01620 [Acidobacteriota bacterium]
MRRWVLQLLPILAGIVAVLGMLHGPSALGLTGLWAVVVGLVLLVGAVLVGFWAILIGNLGGDIEIGPTDDVELPADARHFEADLEGAGFERAFGPLRVVIGASATLWGYRHSTVSACGASIYRSQTVPPRSLYELVSRFDGPNGGSLTTTADAQLGIFPPPPQVFKQVLPGADAERLLSAHLAALSFLETRGVKLRAAGDVPDVETFRREIQAQRRVILARPVHSTLSVLWRIARRRNPRHASILEQPGVETNVAKTLALQRRS